MALIIQVQNLERNMRLINNVLNSDLHLLTYAYGTAKNPIAAASTQVTQSWSICVETTCFSCRKWKWSWLSVYEVSTLYADKGEEEEEKPFVIERYAVSKLEANAQLTLQ